MFCQGYHFFQRIYLAEKDMLLFQFFSRMVFILNDIIFEIKCFSFFLKKILFQKYFQIYFEELLVIFFKRNIGFQKPFCQF